MTEDNDLRSMVESHGRRLENIEILLERNTLQLGQLNDLTVRLANSVEAFTSHVSEELPALTAAVERLERIVDYLIRRDSERRSDDNS